MAGNITIQIDHKTLKQQAHEARLVRADQDLALEKAKMNLVIKQVDERRAEREKEKGEKANA